VQTGDLCTISIAEEDRPRRWRALTAIDLTAGLFPLSLIGYSLSLSLSLALVLSLSLFYFLLETDGVGRRLRRAGGNRCEWTKSCSALHERRGQLAKLHAGHPKARQS